MIIAILVKTIIVFILLLVIIIINNNNNQVIWLKKCILRLCLKVFKLFAFLNVSAIWFQNEGPMKDKTFWLVFVFWKGLLSCNA